MKKYEIKIEIIIKKKEKKVHKQKSWRSADMEEGPYDDTSRAL